MVDLLCECGLIGYYIRSNHCPHIVYTHWFTDCDNTFVYHALHHNPNERFHDYFSENTLFLYLEIVGGVGDYE